MTNSNPINIVFGVNKKFVPYISVVIASILQHSSKDNFFNFYVLSFENLKNEIDRFVFSDYHNYNIYNHIVDRSKLPNISIRSPRLTIDTFLRMYIPLTLQYLDRCIYLDADVLVNKDIAELYKTNLDHYYVGGVSDNFHSFEKFLRDSRNLTMKKYGLKDGIYINSGVLLFNLKAIRDDAAEKLLISTLIKYSGDKDLLYYDQDLVNIAFNGKIKTIDPRWNAIVNFYYRTQVDCFILHFTSFHKPWNWPVIPAHFLYLENAKISPYYEIIKNNLLSATDAYIALFKKHLYIYKFINKMYNTYKIKIFRHYALKMHTTKYNRAIELKEFLTHQKIRSTDTATR